MKEKMEGTKYLIIGNSAGAIGAVEAIRQADKTGRITIVADEPYPAYSRPLIAEYLSERCSLERMLYRPADFYTVNGVDIKLGLSVQNIDVSGHTAALENGKTIGWEKLLLATGGSPIIPAVKGLPKKGVFTFTTLDDAKAIDAYLDRVENIVVIGGGLIGVSVTESLVKRGKKVTIIEMKDRLLNTILDVEASAIAAAALRAAGVNIMVNRTATEIGGDAAVESLTPDNKETVPCGMVVLAIGVRPRLELAAGAGITVNRGIVVNSKMETSAADVYACGDVAEAYDFIYDENRVVPIWPNAYLQGRTAGFNMAGFRQDYAGGTSMNSLKYFGLSITSAGNVLPPAEGCEIIRLRRGSTYRKIVLKDNKVIGMLFTGDIEKSGIVLSLMKDKLNTAKFKGKLVADDFGLACLPESYWRSRIGVSASVEG